jgi:predicted N-formylglutamate amidohydrolase
MDASPALALGAADPPPFELVRKDGAAPLVLTCEHAGNALPETLIGDAPPPADMARHIAFDIGAAAVARSVAQKLDAALVLQPYSRLVIDCNRPRHAPDLAPAISDATRIPFNEGLCDSAIQARWQAIHQPFHQVVDRIVGARGRVALIAIHSFTQRLNGQATRRMAAGLIARQDRSLSKALSEALQAADRALEIVLDAPYRIEDDSDYTIPTHGERRGLPHVLVEIRNDLIATPEGAERWSDLLAEALNATLPAIMGKG